jgi:RsmE family RNA methyltransferase
VLIVVGPEGGLTDREVEMLAPRFRLGLGPHLLRAETAAVAAAAVMSVLRGFAPRTAGANRREPG